MAVGIFEDWSALAAHMHSFAENLESLPGLMGEYEVAPDIIELRRPEIEQLARELRAMKGA
jgi:hypothetical protein